MKALLGKKVGMTKVFDKETGKAQTVTILDVSENVVARTFEQDEAKQIEVGVGKKKEVRAAKSDLGQYKQLKFVPKHSVVLKFDGEAEAGSVLKADVFTEGDVVDIIGTSKGKGFAGVMKRHGFKGGKRTHGQSDRDRAPGSVGSGTTPGRVLKGKKMAGRMGRERTTVQNLKVVSVDVENNLVLVSGSVPGAYKTYVLIKDAKRTK